MNRATCACVFGLAVLVAAGPRAADTRPSMDDVLARTGAYLKLYESQLSSVVAEEHYEQQYTNWEVGRTTTFPQRRTLDSDFLFLRLPGNNSWMGLRDTFRVDGKDVRPANSDLFRSLHIENADDVAAAVRISSENARRNLGDVFRTVNVPTMTLDFFTDGNRGRFRFRKSGEEKKDGRVLWHLTFNEIARPTMVKTAEGADERSRGTVSVDPLTGAVERTVLDLGDDSRADGFVRSRITVVYGQEPALGFRVPVDMVESYYRPPSREYSQLQIATHATYSRFRRFQTSAKIREP